MHASIFAQISLIIALAAVVSLFMRLIRQPLIIGYILTGIIVGPSVFHLTKSPDTIEVFSNIGIALLLFIIGLGLNPRVIKEVGKVAGIAGVLQVILITLIGYGGGIFFGFTKKEAVFFGTALAFSSTIIILKLLSDKKEQSRLYGKVTTGMLLIQDVLAMLALLFVTSQSTGHFDSSQLVTLLAKGALIATPLLFIGNVLLPRLHKFIAGSPEFLFLFALGWGFGAAALFEMSGFSLEIGALLAGISLASLPYTQEISARLRPLRDFFIVVFFIALGTRLSLGNMDGLWGPLVAACAIVVVVKPVIVTFIMGLMGYTKRTSFKAGIALGQVSEFSLILIVLGAHEGLIGDRLVTLMTLTALISIAVSTYAIIYAEPLYEFFEKHFVLFERKKADAEHESRNRYELVLLGYRKGGHEFLKVFRSLKKRFVVIDYDPDVIDILEHQKVDYLYGDVSDLELLEELGLSKVKLIVSTITDHETNMYLVKLLDRVNPEAVVVCHGESIDEAINLYEAGASYVMMPHYIGSEKIGSFIKRTGFKRSEFKRYREKHLLYLEEHHKDFETDEDAAEAEADKVVESTSS